jgi:hypothetical protein
VIEARVSRNPAGQAVAFEVCNHGKSNVCAAVSMLVINTINSIEAFTEAVFTCDWNEKDCGFIKFELESCRSEEAGREAGLLLDALMLGLTATAEKHPCEITMKVM